MRPAPPRTSSCINLAMTSRVVPRWRPSCCCVIRNDPVGAGMRKNEVHEPLPMSARVHLLKFGDEGRYTSVESACTVRFWIARSLSNNRR